MDPAAPRRVVYTVLVGGYETLLDQHVAGRYDTDLIAFTDNPDAVSNTWQIRLIEPEFPLDGNRSSRRPKILTHDYLADYDESLYVDNTVLLTVDPAVIFDRLLPAEASMALFRHSFRADLGAEFETVVKTRRESAWVCDEQREHYSTLDPAVLRQVPYWGGFLLRRHNRPEVRDANDVVVGTRVALLPPRSTLTAVRDEGARPGRGGARPRQPPVGVPRVAADDQA